MPLDFPLTDWSLLVRAGGPDSPARRGALESLCVAYRAPIIGFLQHRAWDMAGEEEDLAQGFIADFIHRESLSRADRSTGRFRDFLKGALRHFIINERRQRQTQKRGGRAEIVSYEAAGEPQPVDEAEWSAAGQRMDAAWARAAWDRALARLRAQWDARRPESPLREWESCLAGESDGVTLTQRAEALGLTLNQANKRVSEARAGLRRCLEEEVAATVAPEEVHDELRWLLTVLAGGGAG